MKKLCEYRHKWVCSRCGVRKADTDAFQIAFRWNSNNIFYRRKQNDTWEPWVPLRTVGRTCKENIKI
jgi:hypothetical protein